MDSGIGLQRGAGHCLNAMSLQELRLEGRVDCPSKTKLKGEA